MCHHGPAQEFESVVCLRVKKDNITEFVHSVFSGFLEEHAVHSFEPSAWNVSAENRNICHCCFEVRYNIIRATRFKMTKV
jgi:hypothetical protein